MKKEKIYKLLTHLVLLAGVICMLLPLFWMLMTSFKNNIEAVAVPMTVSPRSGILEDISVFGKEIL